MHSILLDIATVTLFIHDQSASLHALRCPHRVLETPFPLLGLTCIKLGLSADLGVYWPMGLIAQNWKMFRCLWLLDESEALSRCFGNGIPTKVRQTLLLTGLPEAMEYEVKNSDELLEDAISPKWLSLCGLCLDIILTNDIGQAVDIGSLTVLILESCEGLSDAFNWLTDSAKELRLQSLTIRHDKPDHGFQLLLETFFLGQPGLRDLYILLEGNTQAQSLDQILTKHGPTFKTLVWDETKCKRTTTERSIHAYPEGKLFSSRHLNVISQHCPDFDHSRPGNGLVE